MNFQKRMYNGGSAKKSKRYLLFQDYMYKDN